MTGAEKGQDHCALPGSAEPYTTLRGNAFVWRGNEMAVKRMRPRATIARMRPRLQEIAQDGRRRLRALRARAS